MEYTIKIIELEPTIEETADIYNKPIYEFFADKVEYGNKVEIVVYECNRPHFEYSITGIHLVTREEANKLYAELISKGYTISKKVVE